MRTSNKDKARSPEASLFFELINSHRWEKKMHHGIKMRIKRYLYQRLDNIAKYRISR